MPGGQVRVPLDSFAATTATQPRCAIDMRIVERYRQALKDGAVFPPIYLFADESGMYLADGFHRVEAHKQEGREDIEAEIHDGSERDAVLYSVGVNETHGFNRSNEDKRRAVDMLLDDEEWSTWTDREIARQCRVSHTFVSKRRESRLNERAAPPRTDDYHAGEVRERIERARRNPNQADVEKAVALICAMPMSGADYRLNFGYCIEVEKAQFAIDWLQEYVGI